MVNRLSIKLLIGVAIVLFACGSPIDKTKDQTTSSFYEFSDTTKQLYRFDLKNGLKMTSANGTFIEIPSDAFILPSGNFEGDSACLELREYYTISDIFFSKLSTCTNQKELLETAGMLYLDVKSKGSALQLKESKKVKIGFPWKKKKKKMKLYLANNKNDNFITWGKVISDSIINNHPDSIRSETGKFIPYPQKDLSLYLFETNNLGLINCDRVLEGENKTSLTFEYNRTNIPATVLIFKNIKSIASAMLESKKQIFYNIPMDEEAILISYYKDGNKCFFYEKKVIIKDQMKINPDYKEIDINELKNRIRDMVWNEDI